MNLFKTLLFIVVVFALWVISVSVKKEEATASASIIGSQSVAAVTDQREPPKAEKRIELTEKEKAVIEELLTFMDEKLSRKYPRHSFLLMNDVEAVTADFLKIND